MYTNRKILKKTTLWFMLLACILPQIGATNLLKNKITSVVGEEEVCAEEKARNMSVEELINNTCDYFDDINILNYNNISVVSIDKCKEGMEWLLTFLRREREKIQRKDGERTRLLIEDLVLLIGQESDMTPLIKKKDLYDRDNNKRLQSEKIKGIYAIISSSLAGADNDRNRVKIRLIKIVRNEILYRLYLHKWELHKGGLHLKFRKWELHLKFRKWELCFRLHKMSQELQIRVRKLGRPPKYEETVMLPFVLYLVYSIYSYMHMGKSDWIKRFMIVNLLCLLGKPFLSVSFSK